MSRQTLFSVKIHLNKVYHEQTHPFTPLATLTLARNIHLRLLSLATPTLALSCSIYTRLCRNERIHQANRRRFDRRAHRRSSRTVRRSAQCAAQVQGG
jgi:hypothetical protein